MRGIIAEQQIVAATFRWAALSLKAVNTDGKNVPRSGKTLSGTASTGV
jgi:hypothetical protein